MNGKQRVLFYSEALLLKHG